MRAGYRLTPSFAQLGTCSASFSSSPANGLSEWSRSQLAHPEKTFIQAGEATVRKCMRQTGANVGALLSHFFVFLRDLDDGGTLPITTNLAIDEGRPPVDTESTFEHFSGAIPGYTASWS
jgi:hypothetical protein